MRVAVIGGGVAGLATAWLLEEQHSVTLFEARDRLGGHADTCQVEVAGQSVAIDGGFEFFSDRMFPRFCRLLRLLEVPERQYPLTVTVYTVDHRRVTLLPPWRNGRIVWSALGRRQLAELVQLRRLLRRAGDVMHARDRTTTVQQLLDSAGISAPSGEAFVFPLLQSGWCLSAEEFRNFAAYNALRYAYLHQPTGLRPAQWREVEGGTQTYILALASRLNRTSMRTESDVMAVERTRAGYEVVERGGARAEFDQVVLATNAVQAREILRTCSTAGAVRDCLARFEYFETVIAIHGDARLMPRDRRHWSVVNIRHDGELAWTTVHKPWRSAAPVFKSWISSAGQLPDPLYRRLVYQHAKVTPEHFAAQQALAPLLGQDGLWIAGMYTDDVDCHESALLSAVRIAERLAPSSVRLSQLKQEN